VTYWGRAPDFVFCSDGGSPISGNERHRLISSMNATLVAVQPDSKLTVSTPGHLMSIWWLCDSILLPKSLSWPPPCRQHSNELFARYLHINVRVWLECTQWQTNQLLYPRKQCSIQYNIHFELISQIHWESVMKLTAWDHAIFKQQATDVWITEHSAVMLL
jgi:hypothetical protein